MPNWVYNSLTITPLAEYTGDKKALVKKIKRKLEKTYTLDDGEKHKGFSLNNIIPMPQNKWDYDWCVANWGCKWDVWDAQERHDDDDELCYSFQTPWSPPSLQMLATLCKEFPISIDLEWEEEEGFGKELTIYKDMVFIEEEWDATCIECETRKTEEEMCECGDHCLNCCDTLVLTKGTKDKPLTFEEILEWAMCECENCCDKLRR